ncbi:MAG: hypothetical protein IJI67_10315 [Clostridia bacterium]|nr:hypothetical protein [Clostridia bacterium]
MKKHFKKALSLVLVLAVLLCAVTVGFVQAGAVKAIADSENNKYKIRLLVFEVDTFDGSNKAFGGDSAPYVNYGSEHIGADEEWCRIDYKTLNGTGSTRSAYITLYDRDGDGRYNVVSAWGSSGGYFPSKNGMIIDGFPTHLYAQYYKTGNSWQGKNGQYRIFLQVASFQNGEWVWAQGTNEEIGDAVMNDSFDSDAQSTYGGGLLDLMSTRSGDNVKNVPLIAEGNVPQDYWPKARTGDPSVSYELSTVICPRSSEEPVVNPLLVENAPKDQYGVNMSAEIELESDARSIIGVEQEEWNTTVTTYANLPGGDYNSEAYNSQTITASIRWPQHFGVSKKATVSFLALDYQCTVFLMDQNGNEIDETDYYYGCLPNLPDPAKAYDESQHFLNCRWDHTAAQVSDTANNTYTLLYETAEHSFTTYELDDINYHKAICSVGNQVHSVKERHEITERVVDPTCTAEGYTAYSCAKCGYYYETDFVSRLGHNWDAGVVTEEPSCEKAGTKLYTCSRCEQTKTESISALEHEPILRCIAPTDKANGGVYFECENCGVFWAAVYSDSLQDYDIPDETPLESAAQALAASDALAAPYFNIYTDSETGYAYQSRGASLKYLHLNPPSEQPLRFTASVRVPEQVDYRVGNSGNAVTDVGIVYSRSDCIGGLDDLEIGKPQVFKMSVKERNSAAVYDGSNWGGISKHEEADGIHLSFNLVIGVAQANWTKDYCARAYITYRINGMEFTVYDEAFSSRSVAYIARQVIANESEPLRARQYCQTQIIDKLSEL